MSDVCAPTLAGPEIGVASTKAFTCQLVALAALALGLGRARGTLSEADEMARVGELVAIPGLVAEALKLEPAVEKIARALTQARDVLYLGRGAAYPLAMEGALKLKELSYIHAEGYPAGELKHGPIALIDAAMPVIVLGPRDAVFEKTISNMQEGRGARRTDRADRRRGSGDRGGGPDRKLPRHARDDANFRADCLCSARADASLSYGGADGQRR